MKFGPEKNPTKKEIGRHRAFCAKHGAMSWSDYINHPKHKGERKKQARPTLLGRISAWVKLLMFSAGLTPSSKSAVSRAATKAKGKGRVKSTTSAKALASAKDRQTVVRFVSVSGITHQAPAESLSMLELASGDGTKKNS